VSLSAGVGLIFPGWLPQDGTSESERASKLGNYVTADSGPLGLETERNQLHCNMIAHKSSAGHSQTLAAITEVI
jgi:hypothetical protein